MAQRYVFVCICGPSPYLAQDPTGPTTRRCFLDGEGPLGSWPNPPKLRLSQEGISVLFARAGRTLEVAPAPPDSAGPGW